MPRLSGTTLPILLGAALLAAQPADRPLTDADVTRILPVLEVDAAAQKRVLEEERRRQAASRAGDVVRGEVVAEITSGRLDPLAWLKQKSPHTAAPSTGIYQAACSRAVAAREHVPAALFSFGVEAPRAWKAILKSPGGAPEPSVPADSGQRPGPRISAESLVQQTRTFYSSRKFTYQGEPKPFRWMFVSPDGTIGAAINGMNAYADLEACKHLAFGPQVVVRAEEPLFSGNPPAEPGTPAQRRDLDEALKRTGLSDLEYQSIKMKLLLARADARDPSGLKVDTGYRPASPEEAAAAREVQALIAIRKENIEVYQRNATKLDPLLEVLGPRR